MQQSLFGDNTQYTDQDLRQVTTAQSRVRVHITEPQGGEFYPHVQGYHVDDTRIPIKYVKQGNNGQLSIAIEDNVPTINWTPEKTVKQVGKLPIQVNLYLRTLNGRWMAKLLEQGLRIPLGEDVLSKCTMLNKYNMVVLCTMLTT